MMEEVKKQIGNDTLHINISGVDLSETPIPDFVLGEHNPGLYELYIESCKLKEIPEAIFQKTELRDLHLMNNNISIVPNEIANLKYLYMPRCAFRFVIRSFVEPRSCWRGWFGL